MIKSLQNPEWLQTDALYLECLPLTPGLSETELRQLVELHLEANSPVLLEQLFWGYIVCGNDCIWILAVPRAKADRERFERVTSGPVFHQAVFGILLYRHLGQPDCIVVNYEKTSIAFRKTSEDSLPEAMVLPAEKAHRVLLRQQWIEPGDGKRDWQFIRIEGEGVQAKSYFRRTADSSESDDKEEVAVTLDHTVSTDGLDLRADEIIQESLTLAGNEKRFARITMVAAMLSAMGIMALILLWILQFNLQKKIDDLSVLETEARQVDEAQELVLSLRQAGVSGLRPLQILARINQPRPDSLYFTSVEIRLPNQLSVSGVSGAGGTVAELNRYIEAISSLPGFRNIRPSITSRAGRLSFDISLEFDPEIVFRSAENVTTTSRRTSP